MDAQEFAEWVAYDRLDPFGNDRQDLNAAGIMAMIYNAHSAKGSKAPKDFMWDFDAEPVSLKAKFRSLMGPEQLDGD